MKSGHLCLFIIELLYIISRHLARESDEKGTPLPDFLPPVLWRREHSLSPFLQVFSKKNRGTVFQKKELLIL
jgi:hypothetical protein